MKKILSIVLAGLTLFLLGSCSKEFGPVYNPENAVPPVLGDLVLAADDSLRDGAVFGTMTFAAADFGVDAAIRYTLYVDLAGNEFANEQSITNTTSVPDSAGNISIEIMGKDLNNALMTLNCEPLVAANIDLRVVAEMMGTANAIEGISVVSESKNITVIPYNAEKTYPVVYVIGSYNGWDHAKDMFLFSYAEDKENFVGVIDFTAEHAENAFKLTGAPEWSADKGNWGVTEDENANPNAEAKTLALINGDASKDILNYTTYRYYAFHFVKSSLTLNMIQGFDQVGIIGLNEDWENDIVMQQQKSNQVFYADIEVAAATTFKFRLNADWAINWGGTIDALAAGADNIPVEPGNYRVYLDLNDFAKPTARLSTADYGKNNDTPEPPAPEPEPVKGWSLIGIGGDWEKDIPMTEASGVWTAYVTFGENESFKFRKDGAWDEEYTGTFVALGTPFEAVVGGDNISGVPAGFHKVVLNTNDKTITISEGNVWSIIGQVNGSNWDMDVIMTQDGDKWVSPIVTIDSTFKIRHNLDWTLSYGVADGAEIKLDEAFAVTKDNGGNIILKKGDYKITFDLANETVLITQPAFPETMYMIGQDFGGWDWSSDGIVTMNPVASEGGVGQFWAIRYIDAANGFKFCSKKEWNGDFHSLTTNTGYTEKDGNCFVAESGLYMIHIDLKREMVHMEKARVYGIGDCFGGWDAEKAENLFATSEDGKTVSATLAADGQIRIFAASGISNTDWWTREFVFFDGKIAYRGNGGDQERVSCTAGQVVTLDFNAGTATLQ